jgi:hypothetical protein
VRGKLIGKEGLQPRDLRRTYAQLAADNMAEDDPMPVSDHLSLTTDLEEGNGHFIS